MDHGLDIILLAMVAVFLVARLYKVLGRRTGHEQPRDPFAGVANDDARRDKIIPLPDRGHAPRPDDGAKTAAENATVPPAAEAGPLQPGINRIRSADPGFDPALFVAGARAAFELILPAYAGGDLAALRPLLNDEVFDNFGRAIRSRQQARQTLQTTLVGINSTDLIEADLQGRNAVATVKIVSDQINVTRDADGKVVDGDPTAVATVTDIWMFSRNTRSRDPNWTLVATRSPN
jgi:predicted lipid-binding transport protein (Tim44 family)